MTTPDENRPWLIKGGRPDTTTAGSPTGGYPPPLPQPGGAADPYSATMDPSTHADPSAGGGYPTGAYPAGSGYPPPAYPPPGYPAVPYGQPGYGQPFAPGYAAPRNGLGTAALVVGIIGVVLSWTVYGGIVLGILAICFGAVGLGRVKRGEATNRSSAMAGLVLGIVAIALLAVLVVVGIGLVATTTGGNYR